ncbi:hypothetical protein KIN20_026286 [Parelaphostrongylus tenuis]|uniref:Choline O-acetyltransferase n=1 Tax=Parelaphostrongylus tenuis TaxID=148309 RepID=A0AAD5MZF9_PARTN|nr:hypothetical protein KIN20_026286 [Parelaphostrongylus tenuis]
MAESALRYERENRKRKMISRPERQISAKPLTWHVAREGLMLLEKQKEALDELTRDLDLEVLVFEEFGRNFIKKAEFSPDGFVQLALQLAHFKLHGYLVSTYESASLRRFRFGRVDNIRASTKEALEWVKAMTRNESKETKLILLRRAAEKQAIVTQENLAGHGIDNHLCALYVLARRSVEEGEIETLPQIFRDPLWTELMRFPLSTSQVTTSADITDCYLCYGAVVHDGYGCSYNLQNDAIIFAPSAFKSNPRTNLVAFKNSIRSGLQDMRKLLGN